MDEVLQVEDHGRLRVLRLNRPQRKNALDGALLHALDRTLSDAVDDDGVWALALTGNADAFCSGADIGDASMFGGTGSSEREGGGAGVSRAVGPAGLAMLMRVRCEKPIVAGVNGAAVGGGLALAMAADIRIAAPSARFHPGYARIGVSPDLGLSWTLPQAIGYERAMRFLLEQRSIDAAEALRLGIISEVVPGDEDLDDRLIEYGTSLTRVAPTAARQTKRLVGRIGRPDDVQGHLDLEIELVVRALRSEDCAAAITALLSGEPPEFTGD